MSTFPHERSKAEHSVGDFLRDRYHGVQGECVKVEWSVTFGTWAYLIRGITKAECWVYQGHFLRRI